jgi:hypothetical protein
VAHLEALRRAGEFMEASRLPGEPPLAIDTEQVRERDGLLIVPYNSAQYVASRNPHEMLLSCWPMLVELKTGRIRFGELDDRPLWHDGPLPQS